MENLSENTISSLSEKHTFKGLHKCSRLLKPQAQARAQITLTTHRQIPLLKCKVRLSVEAQSHPGTSYETHATHITMYDGNQ
jgi:hypothetical protein